MTDIKRGTLGIGTMVEPLVGYWWDTLIVAVVCLLSNAFGTGRLIL